MHQGKPFTLANPLLFRPPVHFIFQPQTDKEGLLQGVLVHIFQDTNVSSPEWKESMYQPANVYNNQFRMPLSQIFSVLNLLQIEYQKDETLQKYLGNINWYCYRILRTVVNFSMDNRIQSGQLKPKMQAGDLVPLRYKFFARIPKNLYKMQATNFFMKFPVSPLLLCMMAICCHVLFAT